MSSGDSSSDELEVAPPQKPVKARLSFLGSGGDPIELDDSDSDDNELPLAQRLQASSQPAAAGLPAAAAAKQSTAKKPSLNALELASSSDDDSIPEMPVFQRIPRETYDRRATTKSTTQKKAAPSKRQPTSSRKAPPSSQESNVSTSKTTSKQQAKQAAAEERQRQKLERERAAEIRRQDMDNRKRVAEAKKVAKEAEKIERKRALEQAQQANGKHAKDEICVLMETALYEQIELPLVDEIEHHGYKVQSFPAFLDCRAVQWIRRDYIKGGGVEALKQLGLRNKSGYTHCPVLAIVMDQPEDFIGKLERDFEDDDDFQRLEVFLNGLVESWRQAWGYTTERPRIFLLLYQVEARLTALWKDWQQQRRRTKPPTKEELHDAVTWMLIQFQVECVFCPDPQVLSHELSKMTRMLAEEPYKKATTDLDCVEKKKRTCDDNAPPYEQAKDCWLRQLQVLPSVSIAKARSLTSHYPTARSLWLAYQDEELTEDEKKELVADLMGKQRQVKLSANLYRILTSDNPDEVIG